MKGKRATKTGAYPVTGIEVKAQGPKILKGMMPVSPGGFPKMKMIDRGIAGPPIPSWDIPRAHSSSMAAKLKEGSYSGIEMAAGSKQRKRKKQ